MWAIHRHRFIKCTPTCEQIEIVEERVGIWREEELEERINVLRNDARRIHCGLVLNGGFVEHEVPDLQTVISYDALGEMNAGNFSARRSLEDTQATGGQYWGHRVMLRAATDGAAPSEGPLNRIFKIGNREISTREQYIAGQVADLEQNFSNSMKDIGIS